MEYDQPGQSKWMKFTSVASTYDTSDVDHIHAFSLTWLDEFKSDGLMYSVTDNGA